MSTKGLVQTPSIGGDRTLRVSHQERLQRQQTTAIPVSTRKTTSTARQGSLTLGSYRGWTSQYYPTYATMYGEERGTQLFEYSTRRYKLRKPAQQQSKSEAKSVRHNYNNAEDLTVQGGAIVMEVPVKNKKQYFATKGFSQNNRLDCCIWERRSIKPSRPQSACARLTTSCNQHSASDMAGSHARPRPHSARHRKPQSEACNRLRPPSAGSWAGRPKTKKATRFE